MRPQCEKNTSTNKIEIKDTFMMIKINETRLIKKHSKKLT